jgi:predicted ATPase
MELLERASFLQMLASHADEARRREGRLVLVSGESGIGKTAAQEPAGCGVAATAC